MNILFFGTKGYDKEFFEKLENTGIYHDIDITFIEPNLTPETAKLAENPPDISTIGVAREEKHLADLLIRICLAKTVRL